MRRKQCLILVVTAFLVFTLASQSLAFWGPAKKPVKPRKEGIAWFIDELNLTPRQKKDFKSHRKEMNKVIKEHRNNIQKYAVEMKNEMHKDKPDKRAIHNYIRRISDLRVKVQIKRVDSLLKLRESLTGEQRIKFRKLLESRDLKHKISCGRDKIRVKFKLRG